ncbi:MAG: hypothetical protein SPI27_02465 [Bacteroidaceae bacterium]|nr:hypothetical protein [Bacteroidaceae bacterium]
MKKRIFSKQWHLACAGISLLAVGWRRRVSVKAGRSATVKIRI